ncbi:hypothetical protein SAMN05216227_102223 [Pseudorhodobacter antarcticus]|uniref:Uncharacterized protein n=1 Tax=Pseudorhodobacter antarcticus TaxID=1077947 RepID=A0A1H8IWA0_9RHOB|nr:hypothetical protein [Pseudorhodobacter antarcticus]SEN72913.1 hypothetical protein SAMN05216227_102223 [Pseudorhodobacter antarcticus]
MKIRTVTPRYWVGLALMSAAVGGMAQAQTAPEAATAVVQTEGGEGGEAGAVAGVDAPTAYVVRIAIVEGHLDAAANLYAKGMVDEAIGLSYHPEAEMMDDVRAGLAANGAADFSPQMQAFSSVMEAGGDPATALAAFKDAATAAMGAPDAKMRFTVALAVLRAAAAEYAGSIEGGAVVDVMAYHEAEAFVGVARDLLTPLVADADLGTLAGRAQSAMDPAAAAFGRDGTAFAANDPAILLAVAARVELLSSQVR